MKLIYQIFISTSIVDDLAILIHHKIEKYQLHILKSVHRSMEPFLPWDLLCFELPNAYYKIHYLFAFMMLVKSSYVCKRLYSTWRGQVRIIPDAVLLRCTKEIIKDFPRLEELNMACLIIDRLSTIELLGRLRSLKKLVLPHVVNSDLDLSKTISDEFSLDSVLSKLTKLTFLDLNGTFKPCKDNISMFNLTNEGLRPLTSLTSLNLPMPFSLIDDEGISHLTNLKVLHIGGGVKISNDGISKLTNLETLYLGRNANITTKGTNGLKKLVEIYPQYNTDYGYVL